MTYDWTSFTAQSDRRYRNARQTGNFGTLAAHNILTSGDAEVCFIADVVRSHGCGQIRKGAALDVCCGSGYMSSCLANQGYRVRAFDMNADAIEIARQNHPDVEFLVDDASSPGREIAAGRYDLILIREAHPFSRIRDDQFQSNLILKYLDMLVPDGVLAIGHARRGGGMDYPSMSFEAAGKMACANGASAYGPYFLFFYKHFRLRGSSRGLIKMASAAAHAVSRVVNSRWIEYLVIQRTVQHMAGLE